MNMGGLLSVPSKQSYNETVRGQQSRTDALSRMVATSAVADGTIHVLHGNDQNEGGGNTVTTLSPSWMSSSSKFMIASVSISFIPTAAIGALYYLSHRKWKQQLVVSKLEEKEQIKQHLLDINAQLDQQKIMLHELQQQLLLLNRRCKSQYYRKKLLQHYLCRQRDKRQQRTTICSCHYNENNKVAAAVVEEETVQAAVEKVTKEEEERDEDTILTNVDHDGLTFTSNEEEQRNERMNVVTSTCDESTDNDADDENVSAIQTTPIVQVTMEVQPTRTPTQPLVSPLSPLSPPSLWSTATAGTKKNDSSMLLGPARVLPAALVSPDQQRTAVVDAWSSPMECSARSTLKCLSLSTSMSSTTPKYMPFLQTSEVFNTSSSKIMLTPQPQRQREQHIYHSIQQVDSRDDDDEDDEEEVGTVVGETMKSSLSSDSRRIQVAHIRHNCEEDEEEAEHQQQQQRASIGNKSSLSIIEGHNQVVVMADLQHEKQNQQPEGGMVRRSTCQEEVADKHYTKGSNKEEKDDEAEQEQQQCTVGIVLEKSSLKNQRHQIMTAGQHKKLKQRYCHPGERIKEKVSNYTDNIISPPNTIRNTGVQRTPISTPKRKPINDSSTSRLVSGGGWNSNTSQFFITPPLSGRRTNILSSGSTINETDLQRWKNSLRT